MNQDLNRLLQLEDLVEELLKEEPQEEQLKIKMQNSGIPYSHDPIERINLVLRALHFEEDQEKRTDLKSSKKES